MLTGFETARSLALHNCKVIFACRNVEKAKKAISIIQEEKNDVDCDILELDLTSLSSVQVAAERFNQKYRCHFIQIFILLIMQLGLWRVLKLISSNIPFAGRWIFLFSMLELAQFPMSLPKTITKQHSKSIIWPSSISRYCWRLRCTNVLDPGSSLSRA